MQGSIKTSVAVSGPLAARGRFRLRQRLFEVGTYQPLSRPLFIYVSRKSLNRTETRQFVVFHLVKAAQIVKQLKYVPPPARGYELAINRVKNGSYGNAFGGKTEIAINMDALLKPELKLTLSRNVRSS